MERPRCWEKGLLDTRLSLDGSCTRRPSNTGRRWTGSQHFPICSLDHGVWNCLCQLPHIDPSRNEEIVFSAIPSFVTGNGVWNCLCQLPHIDASRNEEIVFSAIPSFVTGRTESPQSGPASRHIGPSREDTLPMIRARQRAVAGCFVREVEVGPESPCLVALQTPLRSLTGTMGFAALARSVCKCPPNALGELGPMPSR